VDEIEDDAIEVGLPGLEEAERFAQGGPEATLTEGPHGRLGGFARRLLFRVLRPYTYSGTANSNEALSKRYPRWTPRSIAFKTSSRTWKQTGSIGSRAWSARYTPSRPQRNDPFPGGGAAHPGARTEGGALAYGSVREDRRLTALSHCLHVGVPRADSYL
jgi:hypothetical protein